MSRTKHGRAATKAVTRQDLEADLRDVCELAKKSSGKSYDECHEWINDILDALDFATMMGRNPGRR